MKSSSPKTSAGTRKAVNQIELLQMRVAAAATAWKEAKLHAAQAKRRRKLARLMARRAKKDARAAKERLEQLREDLVQAQARIVNPWQAAARSLARAKRTRAGSRKRPAARTNVRKRVSTKTANSEPASSTLAPVPDNPVVPASTPDTTSEIHATN